jgi:hypothetical protein
MAMTPKPPANDTASEPPPSEENKAAKSLRQRLEEAGIEVLPSEHPTREVLEESLKAAGFKVPPTGGGVTKELLESLGMKVLPPPAKFTA